ncbi:hypothetical protein E4U19_004558 [Claviceps sp. Clav32 group G5]|nr:hypothetical protein E4U19_004558 [Claviceps sp. Clav32 group G5]KAG6045070.1 hypothetical protein E4U39_002752 [Claviceps sp. Clav50 group G5]
MDLINAQLRQKATLQSSNAPSEHDCSTRHPVFFTDRLERARGMLWKLDGGEASPVALGYVYLEDRGRGYENGNRDGPKL